MLLIDPRKGSAELKEYFRPYDIQLVDDQYLEFGDFGFMGNVWGDDGTDADGMVGFERKVLSDMLQSMRSNRLSGHQIDGMLEGYTVAYIIIEGIWQCGPGGLLETRVGRDWMPTRPQMMYRELDHYIATLQHKRNIRVVSTRDKTQTAAFIASRYKYFMDKSWSQHRSDEALYVAYNPTMKEFGTGSKRSGFTRRKVLALEYMVAGIDGINEDAAAVAKQYRTMEALMLADPIELAKVEVTRHTKLGVKKAKLGKAKAEKIWMGLRFE